MHLSNPQKNLVGLCSVALATGLLVSNLSLPATAAPADAPAASTQTFQGPAANGPEAGDNGEATTTYAPSFDESTDRIIVKFQDDAAPLQRNVAVAEVAADEAVATESLEPLKETVGGALVLEADQMLDETELDRMIETLETDPAVEYAEPDYIINAPQAATPRNPPNDPYYAGYQWNMRAIDAAGAWRYATGEGVVIGIADTGQTGHPELSGKTLAGHDFVSVGQSRDGDGWDPNPNDEGDWGPQVPASMWHGTHVAGIAAAYTDNGTGVAGVAPNAKVQHARIMGVNGRAYTSDQAAGIAWSAGVPVPGAPANPTPAKVVNYSEGFYSATCPRVLQEAVNAAYARNVPVVAAAGNFGANAAGTSPANCLGAIVVGATAAGDVMTSYSNWGSMLDVLAPGGAVGSDVWSTVNTGRYTQVGPGYGPLNGTSMAAPHVTGIIALMKERNPNLTVEQIRSTLQTTGKNVNGYRFVNASRAVQAVPDTRSNYGLVGAIGAYYWANGAQGRFGDPTTHELVLRDGGVAQIFSRNHVIYWTSHTGAHAVNFSGGIGGKYRAGGYENKYGYPVGDETAIAGGAVQKFALADGRKYAMYWTPAHHRTHVVWEGGAIGWRFTREGGTARYGFPSEDEVAYSYGARQTFNLGSADYRFYWSASTGVAVMNGRGGIFNKWVAMGHAPVVGFPAADEQAIPGGVQQRFRNLQGRETLLVWSPSTGTKSLIAGGGLYHYWLNNGYTSGLGFPTTDETAHADGSVTLNFSSGAQLKWTAKDGVQRIK